jgi:hypothetical protein
MSNDDVNAVILRLARTLQRCGEDPRVVFAALIGSAATLASDLGYDVNSPDDLRRAIDSVIESGQLEDFRDSAVTSSASVVVPFPASRVA